MTLVHPVGSPVHARTDQRAVPLVAVKENTVLCPTSRFILVAVGVVMVGPAETV